MKLDAKIYKILTDKNINFLISGPSIAFANLIDLIEERQELSHIPITKEDEGIGIASGLFTGGRKSIIIINQDGLGNLINVISYLSHPYKIPLILMISPLPNLERKEIHTKNNNLDLMDYFNIKTWRIRTNKEVDNLSDAIDYFDMRKESVAIIFESSLEGI
jgi:sulfopyruvate decarboxylase TPP-binding subunit